MREIAARWAWPAALAVCLFAAGYTSVLTGLDVNWDLKNYHYYNAYALLTGRLGWDLAPAQIQTYHNPLLDLGFYTLVQEIPSPRIIAFAMAMPAGIAAFFLLRMLVSLFPAGLAGRPLWIAAAFAIGVTGASGRSVLGSTMNEWPPAMLLVIALTALVGSIARVGLPTFASMVLAGIATGFAVGLKLTYGVFALGLVVAVMAQGPWKERAGNAAILGAFLFAGFLLAYGFWGATLWDHFGNPFFPYFNHIFQSPWWEPEAWFDRNFGPRDAFQALYFPFVLAQHSLLVGEVAFEDWRLAAVFGLAIALALRHAVARVRPMQEPTDLDPRPWIFLAAFTLVSYVVWLKLYGIYRYLVPLEVISGPLIVGSVLWLVRWNVVRGLAVGTLAGFIVWTTQPGDWGRLPFRGAYFDVAFPDIAPKALVVMSSGEPMAYAIPFARPDARFVSPYNNLLHYRQQNLLSREIAKLIATHEGPIYSLDFQGFERMDEDVLKHFGLTRIASTCLPVRSYLDTSAMQVCRLDRAPISVPAGR